LDHFTDYSSFDASLVGFAQQARSYGFLRGLDCSQDTVHTALTGLWLDLPLFKHALVALYCKDESEIEQFSLLFNRFWDQKGTRLRQRSNYRNQKNIYKQSKDVLVMTGLAKSSEEGRINPGKTTTGANAKETLKSTDFSKLSIHQSEELEVIADQLIREMSLRIMRKRKKSKSGTIDLRNSIRKNLQNGGNIINLHHIEKKREKLKILILLDVSGSMDKYSFFLLKFLWSLRNHFKLIEAFSFSTSLVRISDKISDPNAAIMLSKVAQEVNHWSSGTKIGECLQDFNDNYAKRYLNSKTLTIMMSDGLETGSISQLEEQLIRLKRNSKKLVWLNPLKGMTGYMPIQRGMKAALPAIDIFQSAHNFESLLKLENILADA